MPAEKGWNLVRSLDQNGAWDVRPIASLEEAATLLSQQDEFVLGLPVTAVLAQRLKLPAVEPAEFSEMVRLQVEKALPYSPEEVTSDYEIIEQSENDAVVSAVAVRNETLRELAAPLLERNLIPSQVTVYAAQRAATHAAEGRALLIYPEGERLVSAIAENGKLSLTRTLENPEEFELDLPQLALSAEMQGINTSMPTVFLDQNYFAMRSRVEKLFTLRPEIVGVEAPPAHTRLNLLPESWKLRRAQLQRRGQWQRRAFLIGAGYLVFLLLAALVYGYLRFDANRLQRRVAREAPNVEFVRQAEANWKELAPAIDPAYYPIEILRHLSESLPSADVRITAFNQTARQISLEGEAKSAQLAYQFAERVKKNPGLQMFEFELVTPRILPNGGAQFRLEGKPK